MGIFEVIEETVGSPSTPSASPLIALTAFYSTVWAATRLGKNVETYKPFRRQLGAAILLGLEFLVAADIIRTVAVKPDFRTVGVLGGIVLIRTFLSYSLQLEVTGYWPWQNAKQAQDKAAQAKQAATQQ